MQSLGTPKQKKILLVDDDAFVLRVFRDGLLRQGFVVDTAHDGLEAIKSLQENKPDIVVLDLMMPKFTGVDVVKFIRGRPDLASLPVIILSNSYIDELAQAVQAAGVQEALLKSRCTPSALVDIIHHTLEPGSNHASGLSSGEEDNQSRTRREFLATGRSTCEELRGLFQALKAAKTAIEQSRRLEDFYRKVHFISASAGLAGCRRIEKMNGVFEALLFALMDNPSRLNASVWRTLSLSIDFIESLYQEPAHSAGGANAETNVLVVDDDAVSNRLMVTTLRRIELTPHGYQNPLEALRSLEITTYELILLDIEMPGMDGLEFCRRARGISRYRKTPIIYVTSHADFETHAEGLMSGGTDLIAKPVFPMELAVKTVIHLLKVDPEEVE
jgi:CheY-like chemotaxis protein